MQRNLKDQKNTNEWKISKAQKCSWSSFQFIRLSLFSPSLGKLRYFPMESSSPKTFFPFLGKNHFKELEKWSFSSEKLLSNETNLENLTFKVPQKSNCVTLSIFCGKQNRLHHNYFKSPVPSGLFLKKKENISQLYRHGDLKNHLLFLFYG